MERRTILHFNYVFVNLFGLISTAQGATLQYNMTFNDSILETNGVGSFFWDSDNKDMSTFIWNFEDGKTGGFTETGLDSDFFGGSIGALLFEAFTGEDVHPEDISTNGFSTLGNSMLGGFPNLGVQFYSVNGIEDPSKYRMFNSNTGDVAEGIYVVEAVVPVPASFWLFGSGFFGLAGIARRKKRKR